MVRQAQEPLGVGLHRKEFLTVAFRIISAGDNLVQRHLDQGQRGADLVGYVREEVDLRIIQFFLLLRLEFLHLTGHPHLAEMVPLPRQDSQDQECRQRIQDVGGHGPIERRADFDVQGALGFPSGADATDAELVFPGCEVRIGGLTGVRETLDGPPFAFQDGTEQTGPGGLEIRSGIADGQGGDILVSETDFPGMQGGFPFFGHGLDATGAVGQDFGDEQFQRFPVRAV